MRMTKIISVFILFCVLGCGRKSAPFFTERTVTTYDTITLISKQTDTIPCDDFQTILIQDTDTVYVQVERKVLTVRTINKTDTIYRNIIIETARKNVTKIDNSNTAKKGGVIGDGNTLTTKKTQWIWIFIAGALTWFIIQNIVWRAIKTYIILPI